MGSLSTESTPRERLARIVTLLSRTRMFWRSAAAIAATGLVISLALALHAKRVWRSETTVLYRDGVQPAMSDGESATARAARLGPKLKDLLYARPNLEQVLREYDLFPEKTRRSVLDGVEEMVLATGFRARASDSYVISFSYEDPVIAQKVAARLADRMIDEYNRQNLDTATLTRNFLGRKLEEATARADDASRALATFLAEHPQFQWGGADSPYAPVPVIPGMPAPRAMGPRSTAPGDPTLRALERDLSRVESELGPSAAPAAGTAPPQGAPIAGPTSIADAQRQRDAAAAALSAAEAGLAEKLTSVTPAHPDAVSGRARVDAARRALAAAESTLARARFGAAPAGPRVPLTPERRRALERERAALRRQIEARRAGAPSGEPRSIPRAATAGSPTDIVELETEWHRLRMALDRARGELGTIQQNARAADLSADAVAKQGHEEMQILEPAYVPTRPDRGRGRVFFAGATIALFLALGYAAARVLLNDTLLDEGDIAAIGGPLVLVAMPHLPPVRPRPPERAIVPAVQHGDTEVDDVDPQVSTSVITPPPTPEEARGALAVRPASLRRGLVLRDDPRFSHAVVEAVFDDPEVEVIGADVDPGVPAQVLASAPSAALGALRVLRHRLDQKRGDGSFVVSVMSPGLREGKTSLALRLALTLSESERARVILVEGNFEQPRLAAELGLRLPKEASFSQQIRERMSGRGIPWGVVRLGASLSLLAEPDRVAAHPEAIHSTHFEAAIGALRRSYEYVIVDGPPIVGSGDANVLEAVSDGVLIVVRAAATRGAALTRATQQLGSSKVLGAVLNDVAAPSLEMLPAASAATVA
ncbi:Tyrosine-protein kinase EpsD [Minicystis rosea]|nr:Tyrosine-protein kinase EpsD [Minicystis rosea]